MNILVCVKQVPDTTEVRIDKETGTLIRDGVPSILNPDDANALEEALTLKDKMKDSKVTVISMGPPQADFMLRECLAMGADEAILLSDRAFGGADTWATSNTIAAGIEKIGKYDIIFAGRQAIDGDTAQVGPQIAEKLNIPQITYVQNFEIEGNNIRVERQLEDGYEIVESSMPVLLTAVKELNEPRYMYVDKIDKAFEKDIKVWTAQDLNLESDQIGLKASPTKVFKSFTPEPRKEGVILEGTSKEKVAKLVCNLKEKHLI